MPVRFVVPSKTTDPKASSTMAPKTMGESIMSYTMIPMAPCSRWRRATSAAVVVGAANAAVPLCTMEADRCMQILVEFSSWEADEGSDSSGKTSDRSGRASCTPVNDSEKSRSGSAEAGAATSDRPSLESSLSPIQPANCRHRTALASVDLQYQKSTYHVVELSRELEARHIEVHHNIPAAGVIAEKLDGVGLLLRFVAFTTRRHFAVDNRFVDCTCFMAAQPHAR
jgi:hypothetical protein